MISAIVKCSLGVSGCICLVYNFNSKYFGHLANYTFMFVTLCHKLLDTHNKMENNWNFINSDAITFFSN